MYEPRFYREWIDTEGLLRFDVKVFESDLLILCDRMLRSFCEEVVRWYRKEIIDYIEVNPSFGESLEPIPADEGAPGIIKDMIEKSRKAGVGPMAGVAGAIAEYTGRALLGKCSEVIVENGGDIFAKIARKRTFGIYAGESALSGKVRFTIRPSQTPCGICTSSGTVGHSRSFGIADAATIIAVDAVLADCVATQAGNTVKSNSDLTRAIEYVKSIDGVKGALIVLGDRLATWGDVELL